jgi:hypothetical protein
MDNVIRIGDKINWRGNYGKAIPIEATVKKIVDNRNGCKSEDYYKSSVELEKFVGRDFIVDLTNGYWAYAYQIDQIK